MKPNPTLHSLWASTTALRDCGNVILDPRLALRLHAVDNAAVRPSRLAPVPGGAELHDGRIAATGDEGR